MSSLTHGAFLVLLTQSLCMDSIIEVQEPRLLGLGCLSWVRLGPPRIEDSARKRSGKLS